MGITATSESSGHVRVTGVPGWEGWTARFPIDRSDPEAPRLAGLELTQPPSVTLTAEAVRGFPIGTAMRAALGFFSPTSNPLVAVIAASVPAPDRRPYGGSREHDDAVVTLYRAALAQGVPPRDVIAERFGGVDKTTVSRWLADLRRRDVLKDYATERARALSPAQTTRTRRVRANREDTP